MELNISKLEELQLSPDEYVFLYFLVNPNVSSLSDLLKVDFVKLEQKGLIKIGPDETYYSRKAAIDLVASGKKEDKDTSVESLSHVERVKELNKVVDWIPDWRALFPVGVKTGGYSVRGTRGGCVKKMRSFLRRHSSVTKDQIFKATKKYIAEKQVVNFAYMKIADYFIEKEGGSLLEEYVESLNKQGEDESLSFPQNMQLNTGDLTDDI
jgi:hypothetical protein